MPPEIFLGSWPLSRVGPLKSRSPAIGVAPRPPIAAAARQRAAVTAIRGAIGVQTGKRFVARHGRELDHGLEREAVRSIVNHVLSDVRHRVICRHIDERSLTSDLDDGFMTADSER